MKRNYLAGAVDTASVILAMVLLYKTARHGLRSVTGKDAMCALGLAALRSKLR